MKPTKKIKVCFIDWFAYGLFNPRSEIVFGGAQIQLYLLAKELAKDKKLSICFLTDSRQTTRQETFSNIKVYQFLRSKPSRSDSGIVGNLTFFISLFNSLLNKLPLFNYLKFFISLLIQIKKIDADIYLQRAASAETGLIALICKILKRRFIFMVAHEQDVNGDFIKKNGFRGKLFLLGLKLADKIICQTKDQQTQLSEPLKTKSVIISSGYPIKSSGRIKAKKQGILWVARAEDWKRPDLFINLAKNFPQEKFTMICLPAENNPEYFQGIKILAQKIPNLKFIKRVPFADIDAYFAKAKVFVSTSISEGFPNTFLQAGHNMTPIISYKVNPDKIFDKYRLGFCANGDESQMIRLLKKVLKDNQLWHQLSINAYNYVKRHHDIKKTAANIIENIVLLF